MYTCTDQRNGHTYSISEMVATVSTFKTGFKSNDLVLVSSYIVYWYAP